MCDCKPLLNVTGNLNDAVAEKDFAKGYGNAAKEVLLNDGFVDGDDSTGSLRGCTSIATPIRSRHGGLQLSLLRPNWYVLIVAMPLDV